MSAPHRRSFIAASAGLAFLDRLHAASAQDVRPVRLDAEPLVRLLDAPVVARAARGA